MQVGRVISCGLSWNLKWAQELTCRRGGAHAAPSSCSWAPPRAGPRWPLGWTAWQVLAAAAPCGRAGAPARRGERCQAAPAGARCRRSRRRNRRRPGLAPSPRGAASGADAPRAPRAPRRHRAPGPPWSGVPQSKHRKKSNYEAVRKVACAVERRSRVSRVSRVVASKCSK